MSVYFGFILATFQINAAENLSDHEQYCASAKQQPCLQYIQQQLAELTPASVSWFKVKSYELDYLFDKQQFAELQRQTEQLLTLESVPGSFAAQLYFYHAKVTNIYGDTEQARHYAGLALDQLQGAFDTFGTPLRLVELANLHYSLRELDKADSLLNEAARIFEKNRDPLFWFEWYSNKALIEHNRGRLAETTELREHAVQAAQQLEYSGKLIVALGNLARTEQLQQYAQAYKHYQQAMTYMQNGSDDVNQAIYILRMAEISWQSGHYELAAEHLLSTDKSKLKSLHLQLYHDLLAKPELAILLAQASQ